VSGPNGERVTATTSVSLAGGTAGYTRSATVTEGTAVIRVAHPGEYTVGNRTVAVAHDDVLAGNQINISPA
jgi:dolichyl-diphosphooligosaccharide--protein glycosyltransferase